ncbi:MAG TPA: cation diffusion facilitator family transporter [Fibrobacteria bacterium]|nr:cation diffusion facilitator family transporter [Fibrobacteria bacterium]
MTTSLNPSRSVNPSAIPLPADPNIPRRATLVAASASLLLICLKLGVGLATGTVSVLASAVDSLLDFLVSSFNAYAVRTSERPSDEIYNYGRGKIEGIAALLEGLFILGSAVYIMREALISFDRPEPLGAGNLRWAVLAMTLSLALTTVLVLYLTRLARRTRSLVVEADLAHYRVDLISNGSVLLALGIIRLTGWDWIDPLVALAVSVLVARAALPVLRKGLHMLLDRALDPSMVERIRALAEGHNRRVNGVHEVKTRRAGDTNFVDMHIVFDESIRLLEAHRIADEIEAGIRGLEPVRWVINIHLDPVDDSFKDGRFGRGGQDVAEG